jgi:hypothetical protein
VKSPQGLAGKISLWQYLGYSDLPMIKPEASLKAALLPGEASDLPYGKSEYPRDHPRRYFSRQPRLDLPLFVPDFYLSYKLSGLNTAIVWVYVYAVSQDKLMGKSQSY